MARVLAVWTLLASVFPFCSLARADDEPCTVTDGDKFYDLTALRAKKDYELKSFDARPIWINVCQPATSERWAMNVDDPEAVGGFTRREHNDFSLGYVNTTKLDIRDGNPTLTMSKGSPCPTHIHMHAATTIHFKCDNSAGVGEPVLIAQLPPPESASCYYVFEWRTSVACPSYMRRGSWTFVGLLASIAGGLLALYIIVGVFYNYLVLDLRGLDVIPRYSLFTMQDAIKVFRACFARVLGRTAGAFHFSNGRAGTHGGYAGLAEEEGMLSGPTGFLYEDEEEEEPEHNTGAVQPQGMDTNGVIRL